VKNVARLVNAHLYRFLILSADASEKTIILFEALFSVFYVRQVDVFGNFCFASQKY